MLDLFATAGHNNYAKSALLYVQQMQNLSESSTALWSFWMVSGYQSVRRSDRFLAGLSLDLVIEQTMMRAVKSRGGLTRRRGMHETVRET